MSDIPADYQERLNIREQIARIDRAIEEGHKFTAEQQRAQEARKMMAEEQKLAQEARKLDAEHDKLRRDRNLAPWLLMASTTSGVVSAVVVSLITHLWR
jgi:type IV secretory pathway component VirB8